ncbi:MAG: heparinase II/III family protein [Blastocatellia bacterium]
MNPLLLWRTVRHLRWEQIVYRPVRAAQFRLYRAFPRLTAQWIVAGSDAPAVSNDRLAAIRRVCTNSLAHLNAPLEELEPRLLDLGEGRFRFVNRTKQIPRMDWNRRYENHLWNYHLHYFDFAVWCARALAERDDQWSWATCRRLIESWIEQARIGRSDGWDPYPISLHTVNWIYAYVLVSDVARDRAFLDRWRASLHRQLAFLDRHLEFQHLANHLLKNVKALVIGGLFFNQDAWLQKGEQLLWRELDEQVLADGGHFERSPMYHAQALADFLECYALLRAFDRLPQIEAIEAKLRAMARFLAAMRYPDGRLAQFNDSANSKENDVALLLESAARIVGREPASTTQAFPETGYYVWSATDESEKIVVDAGPPSVEYNAAHVHCDLLSYELWLSGRPFIINSGVHGYGGDQFREYARSTRAHNTVMFDGVEQSEVWGTHRMARRARLLTADWRTEGGEVRFRGSYRRYDGALIHERRIRRNAGGDWFVTDCVRGGPVTRAISFIHLHPEVEAQIVNERQILCRIGSWDVMIAPISETGPRTELVKGGESPIQGWYFPDFGVAQPSVTIVFDFHCETGASFGYKIANHVSLPILSA